MLRSFVVETFVKVEMNIYERNNEISLGNQCTDALFDAFIKHMIDNKMVHIKSLEMEFTKILDFRRLKEIMVEPFHITSLNLERTHFEYPDNFSVICDLVRQSTLTHLTIIDRLPVDMSEMAEALKSPTCQLVSLSIHNDLWDNQQPLTLLFGDMLQINTTLTRLSISRFVIDMEELSSMWPFNRTLTHLTLRQCLMQHQQVFADALCGHMTLCHLYLVHSNVNNTGFFMDALDHNWGLETCYIDSYDDVDSFRLKKWTDHNITIKAQVQAVQIPVLKDRLSRCLKYL